MSSSLGWNTLQHRRLLSQCEMIFKIHHKLVNISMPSEVQLYSGNLRTLRSHHVGHNLRYIQPFGRINCYMYSIFPRAIRIWNTLPNTAVTSNYSSWIPGSNTACHSGNVATPTFEDAIGEGHTCTTRALHLTHCIKCTSNFTTVTALHQEHKHHKTQHNLSRTASALLGE